jgi:hypothetical protein
LDSCHYTNSKKQPSGDKEDEKHKIMRRKSIRIRRNKRKER